jgi:hypothetical protein
MFGIYYLAVIGLISMTWSAFTMVWLCRNPGKPPPVTFAAGPLVTGAITLAEGVAQLIRA